MGVQVLGDFVGKVLKFTNWYWIIFIIPLKIFEINNITKTIR